ncbi:guanine deaminase [Azospirillum thiophilum]|uniref:Guanine deaminase n=1 Tax=Azospirillum thiophilum TaxID=528244 RepID=A0AAC8W3A5_9PROT|nr:guanine deaminase [Azospirillum thiophilum]ALG74298.1 guanine deaminase [Azospirillum thiophilum]KJR63832.1 guanine deaminase [Azospirillum thiophilum]
MTDQPAASPSAAPVSAAIRGRLLSFHRAPVGPGNLDALRHHEDGLLLVGVDGRIAAVGDWAALRGQVPDGVTVDDHRGRLVLPGFIDTHIHFPQTQVIASYGAQLLDWLEKYTFIEEQKFADPAHAAANAAFFMDELLRNGTTTAVVYGSVHPQSVDALFAEAEARGAGLIAGKVMMDRHAPAVLTDTAESGYRDSKDLIARWHGRGRQRYAVTPRFAITSTEAQLEAAGALLREHPGVHMQTHLSENTEEIATVRRLFPGARDYTDVYDRFGLLGPTSLFGHCIHLSEAEMIRLHQSGSVAVFCPTSNLFIGSGLFDLDALSKPERPVRTAIATDVGGGTSYSMLRTAAEGYKVLQLQGRNLPALAALYWMTRGNAEALGMAGEIGSLEPGCWADLVVLDPAATPAMRHRMKTVEGDLEEELFIQVTLGDDRSVAATYLRGRNSHLRQTCA